MGKKFLEPSAEGLRKPTDPQKENGNIINPPRYAELGGLDSPKRTKEANNRLTISKPGGKK